MKINKGAVNVQAFHYDVESSSADVKTELNISVEHPDFKDENGQPLSEKEGKILQVVVPFEIHPENAPFKVSGLVGQIVQPVGFQGEVQDLEPKDIQQLSRPVVEYIETMTYQITSVALNRGFSLNFNKNIKIEPNEALKELKAKEKKNSDK
ncbi:DUF1149 family protein [Companilactobacillus alimentarius]|uniref:Uncharacterized protein n=1 Tax=Companilactobacillus alimentarius DSM 20249 TaxID=1423720 RepID=A0A2K9HKZ1_9LACO|nr:DUF1149 family protein [Companilactobacillus alimentarius]AUI71605.1 hypothetical protein LA20249_05150 [Companilactobacillus alimentarius DSM 20249]KRK78391.1 hypothetical protein FC67_GL000960 [Companilactobacillus alimentarius DSM 20249]GEO44665.1 hypothetical protein LAL01_08970 [Companilactobacillus alimentarius]